MSARRDKLLSLFYPRRSTTLPFLLDRVLELHSHRYRTRGSFVRLAINTFLSYARSLETWKPFSFREKRKSNVGFSKNS